MSEEAILNDPSKISDRDKIVMLARKVIWAIKYLDCRGSGTMARESADGTKMELISWVTDFCDTLDQVGIVVDRAALDAIRHPVKKSKRVKPALNTCRGPRT